MKVFPPLATDHPRLLRPMGQARDRVPGDLLNLVHVHSSFDEEGGDFSVTLTGDYWVTPDNVRLAPSSEPVALHVDHLGRARAPEAREPRLRQRVPETRRTRSDQSVIRSTRSSDTASTVYASIGPQSIRSSVRRLKRANPAPASSCHQSPSDRASCTGSWPAVLALSILTAPLVGFPRAFASLQAVSGAIRQQVTVRQSRSARLTWRAVPDAAVGSPSMRRSIRRAPSPQLLGSARRRSLRRQRTSPYTEHSRPRG